MEQKSLLRSLAALPLQAVMAGTLAIGIFLVDTFVALSGAVAVLYVIVVLVAARHLARRGILVVAAVCLALTAAGYLLQHEPALNAALLRVLMSLGAIGITTVLSLRNLAAHEVLREQARLLDLTHDTIFARDKNDIITYWNRGAEELYGWTRAEAVGNNTHRLLKTSFPEPVEAIMARLVEAGRWEGELAHTRRDGSTVTVASRWSLERDERGRPLAILETNTDITAKKRADAELNQAQAQLAHVARVTTLGELAASIAHEVNQPLAAIVTNGEAGLRWLGHATPNVVEVRTAVERIVADANRAGTVIRRIRELARKGSAERSALGLNGVIEDVVALVQRTAFGNGVSLRLELAPDGAAVVGDRVQLQQVVMNLVMNAIDAMAAVSDRAREIVIRSRAEEGSVRVEVKDCGVGIDAANAKRLFDAFYTTKRDGMGMGLSICRSIVEAHGGRIWATPNVPHGAVFQFALPAHVLEPA